MVVDDKYGRGWVKVCCQIWCFRVENLSGWTYKVTFAVKYGVLDQVRLLLVS